MDDYSEHVNICVISSSLCWKRPEMSWDQGGKENFKESNQMLQNQPMS